MQKKQDEKKRADTDSVHATCLNIGGIGVLLCGASGCGKSDLALRVIKANKGQLVADDQVVLAAKKGVLLASAPPRLAGLLEVRGLGLLSLAYEPSHPIHMLVRLVAVEDLPPFAPPALERLLDIELPVIHLCSQEASAVEKLVIAAQYIGVSGFASENAILGRK